jgi:hypothetical protein
MDEHIAGMGEPIQGEVPEQVGLPVALEPQDQGIGPFGGQPLDLGQDLLPPKEGAIPAGILAQGMNPSFGPSGGCNIGERARRPLGCQQ